MTDCPNGEIRDLLPDYLHGRLAPAQRADVERHLATCVACREELALLGDLRSVWRKDAPAVDVARIAAAVAPYRAPARSGRPAAWRVAAAIVAIAVGGASYALLRESTPRVVATVPDGSAVRPAASPDSGGTVAVAPAPRTDAPDRAPAARATRPVVHESHELAMAGGAITDLDDGQLSTLVNALESLEAVPSAEVESGEPFTLGASEGT